MTGTRPARGARRIRVRRVRVAALLVVPALGAAAAVGHPERGPSETTVASPPVEAAGGEHRGVPGAPPRRGGGGTTLSDGHDPGVVNLDARLLRALRRAAADAASDGVDVRVESGWRSAEHQEQLLRDAVSEYGSEEEAARWVATPETSAHVSGDAVDIGPAAARAWLARHGAAYGLCQVYANEPWHFELRPEAGDGGCPPMYPDPTHDPRMQQ